MKSLARSVATVAILLAITGCGGGSGSEEDVTTSPASEREASTLSAAPADGATISTDDFTYTVPKGWEQSDQSTALSLAIDLQDKDGFSDNLNVVRDNTVVGVKGDELEEAIEKVLTGVRAADITTKDRIQIDGEEAVHIGAVFETNGKKYRTEQYALGHDDSGYVITFSFSPDVTAAQRDKLSESILATWKWAS
jgi:hypothetical protein